MKDTARFQEGSLLYKKAYEFHAEVHRFPFLGILELSIGGDFLTGLGTIKKIDGMLDTEYQTYCLVEVLDKYENYEVYEVALESAVSQKASWFISTSFLYLRKFQDFFLYKKNTAIAVFFCFLYGAERGTWTLTRWSTGF